MATEIQQPAWANDLHPPARLWYLLLALPIVAVIAFAVFQPIQVLPRISLAPAYSFRDQNGTQVTSEEMRGSLTIYTFAHARCVAPCVSTSATLAALQPALDRLDLNGVPLRFVTLVVDEETVTTGQLQAFAAANAVDPSRWRFLTGDTGQMKNVIGAGFNTYYGQDGTGRDSTGHFTVDPVFVLVDGWGIVRAIYRTPAPDVDLITRDLQLIVTEIKNSTGVTHYAYEAAHLFMCYPR